MRRDECGSSPAVQASSQANGPRSTPMTFSVRHHIRFDEKQRADPQGFLQLSLMMIVQINARRGLLVVALSRQEVGSKGRRTTTLAQ